MSAIPPWAAVLSDAATLLVLDPVFGPTPRTVRLLALGEDVLVEAGGAMCFRRVTGLRPAVPPDDVVVLAAGCLGVGAPSSALTLASRQPVSPVQVGAQPVAAEMLGSVEAQPPSQMWVIVEVDGAAQIIVDHVALATGPLSFDVDPCVVDRRLRSTLRAFVGQRQLDLIGVEALDGATLFRFLVPPRSTALRLSSPHRLPPNDIRRLGVAVQRLQIADADIPLASPALVRGFHDVEQCDGQAWRWTDGDALIILPPNPTELTLAIQIADWRPDVGG